MKNEIFDYINGKNFIDGKWFDYESVIKVDNPATKKFIGTVPNLNEIKINQAIKSADDSFINWSKNTSYRARCSILRKWLCLIQQNIDELAHILTLEHGKTYKDAKGEILYAASFIDYYANLNVADIIKRNSLSNDIIIKHQAIGPVALITPWNFPAAMITRKLAPALAAGCTAVIKPSTLTPFSALGLIYLLEQANLPAGVVNVVTGDAKMIGQVLCLDARIRKLSFTGSTEVGQILYKQASNSIKKLSLELGGNAPFIITNRSDIDEVTSELVDSKLRSVGQSCIAPNRILIENSIYDPVCELLKQKFANLIVGDGMNSETIIGPLINQRAVDKINDLISDATTKGAVVLCGGLSKDHFANATVLKNCTKDMQIFRTEIFGPMLACYKFNDLNEAMSLANDSEYGLQAYIYSNDTKEVDIAINTLDYNMISVNSSFPSNAHAPFGGRKFSGFGVEGAEQGILEYMNYQYINVNN